MIRIAAGDAGGTSEYRITPVPRSKEVLYTIVNAKVLFADFSGTRFGDGKRNVVVIIEDQEFAQRLLDDGFNVTVYVPNDPDDNPVYRLKVIIDYTERRDRYGEIIKAFIPEIHKINIDNRTDDILDNNSVGGLDSLNITRVDLTFRRGGNYKIPRRDPNPDVKPNRSAFVKKMNAIYDGFDGDYLNSIHYFNEEVAADEDEYVPFN